MEKLQVRDMEINLFKPPFFGFEGALYGFNSLASAESVSVQAAAEHVAGQTTIHCYVQNARIRE